MGGPRQRRRRPRGGGRARHHHGAAPRPAVHLEARLADGRTGGRLLLRLRQRGPVAALPHRPRTGSSMPR
jgi:hypothetical protein